MSRAFAIVLALAMIGGGAAAEPAGLTRPLHPLAHDMAVRKTLVHTTITSAGADQARGLLIAALLIGAARSR